MCICIVLCRDVFLGYVCFSVAIPVVHPEFIYHRSDESKIGVADEVEITSCLY